MWIDCPHLSLAPNGAGEDDDRCIVLVEAVEALSLSARGEFEAVDAWVATWEFGRARESLMWDMADLASRAHVLGFNMFWMREGDLPDRILQAIREGDLVGLRRTRQAAGPTDQTLAQRQLVRDIESRVRGHLGAGGRQYKLVAGQDLPGMSDRDSYEVVTHAEAERVLGELAKHAAPGLAASFSEARDMLTPDWRQPFLPNGLVCLRRVQTRSTASAMPEPALTPSQLWRQMREKDDIIDWTIWIELDPADPKADDDLVILLDEFYQEVMRKPLASCPRDGAGVLVTFERINKHNRFTLIRDYGPNEGGGQDTLFIDSTPAEMDARGSQAS